MLNLTSATRVREPGFSPSECLELAKAIERGDLCHPGTFECDDCGADVEPPDRVTSKQAALIVAALRAYAE